MSEWSVGRAGRQCVVTGREFAEGETIIAAIYELPGDGGFVRRDFDPNAFTQTHGHIGLEEQEGTFEPFSHWQTTLRPREQKKPLFVDDAVLVDFFDRLSDASEPTRVQFRYVLALILMRKRILRYEGNTTDVDGNELWQMTLVHPTERDGDKPAKRPVVVTRPEIDETQIAELSEQLGSILAGDDEALTGATA